MRRPLS